MKKYSQISLFLALVITLCTVGCTDDTAHGDEVKQTESTSENTTEKDSPDSNTNVPDNWHIFEYDGIKYDLWEISSLVNGVDEREHIGKYVIAEGHVNPSNSIFAVINTETQTIEHHFVGAVPTYHSDDVNTIVYAFWNEIIAYDGTVLSTFDLNAGEYIYSLSYTNDNTCIEAVISSEGDSRTEIIDLKPFDPDAYAALIPNSLADRLFWYRILDTDDYLYFCAIRKINSSFTSYTNDPPKEFAIYHINSSKKDNIGYIEAVIPADIEYDTICPVLAMDGNRSEECEFILQLTKGEEIFYVSFANYTADNPLTFDFVAILGDDRVNDLKALYPNAFLKAEKYYWHYTLSDFKNENPGDSLVYEGYTVEYECKSPYAASFDFHIHLPQLNSNAPNAEKWNYIYQQYDVELGEQLRKTVHGTNTDYFAHITYDTVTTGDVLTIYIIKNHGILASGASKLDYDIFHYHMKEDCFLSTDEFIAYYAEGQFADYTVADIVKFMNENVFTTDEMGSPYPITEENILGVIPSVYGDGKLDVVYVGYSLEGYHATRTLLSPYPTYTSDAVYTYRLTYHDYLTCHDKALYGSPVGYRLLLSKRIDGQYEVGYYADCLFTEDIAERPESYPESVYGEYYTPVRQDEYGNMHIVVDHETDSGNLNAWIPFGYPETAQDYYRGVLRGYFDYERILDGNYQVNKDIAEKLAEILGACRRDENPNKLLPNSKTEYTPFPLGFVRDNPDVIEIGEILKNASVDENGIINFSIDLGSAWVMRLPIAIGGFAESAQAHFTGIYYERNQTKTHTITDIASWDSLPWEREPYSDWKNAPSVYALINDLVSGESDIPEYNELGIKDYSVTLLDDTGPEIIMSFTFTVTGDSLPETLPRGTHTKIIIDGYDLYLYDNKKPVEYEEYVEAERIRKGLDKFGDIPAVQAVNSYLNWMWFHWEISSYGEWEVDADYLPYYYMCGFYGDTNHDISFSELQQLMSDKFGIEVERPAESGPLGRFGSCEYIKESDTIRYTDTRGFESIHRIIDAKTENEITYVTVQLFADRLYLVPSHKVVYKIGEGDVFLGCEVAETGKYEPFDIRSYLQ